MKNSRILALILGLSLSPNLSAMWWPWSRKPEQPKKEEPAKYGDLDEKKEEKYEIKTLEGKDYISQLPDEIILDIVSMTINKTADTKSKAFGDAINLLSTSKRFRRLYSKFMERKDVKELRTEIEELKKALKIIKDYKALPGNSEHGDVYIARDKGLIIWFKYYMDTLSREDKTYVLGSLISQFRREASWNEKNKDTEQHLKIIQMLIDNGAYINSSMAIPLYQGARRTMSFLAASLFEYSDNEILLSLAKILLDNGAQIDKTVKDLMEEDPKIKQFIEDYLAKKKLSSRQD